jgi:hypothetical protein
MSKLIATTLFAVLLSTSLPADTTNPNPAGSPVRMTVTANVNKDKRAPQIDKADISVKKGKDRLEVLDWTPAKGDRAGLELFFLIDDASTSRLGVELQDLRNFIYAQPSTTIIGVGYARNTTVEIRQNFTADRALAAKALRLPLGNVGASGSPYLSVTNLMQRWPDTPNRREIVLISNGMDRAHRGRNALTNPDVDTAARVAQRSGTMIHTIYFPGVGHLRHHFWEAPYGQNGLAKLSDITGGESFYLGLHTPVSLSPYLEQLGRVLDNQYILTVAAKPGKKAGLQYVTVKTEVAGVDFSTPDAFWVPAAK